MRISESEKNAIVEAIKKNDPAGRVWLFGSRTDDAKKGGDIDIAVLSDRINNDAMLKITVRRCILERIGEQRIDIVTSSDGKEAFFRLAVQEGIELL